MERIHHDFVGRDEIVPVRARVDKGKAEASSFDPSRRQALKSLGGAMVAATLPLIAGRTGIEAAARAGNAPMSNLDGNPRWYGFNLLEYFSTDPDWMSYFPYRDDGLFKEDDFRWIRHWGFTWVRLPMDYRFWTDPHDLMKIDEKKIEPIDRAVRLGETYGIHVNISLHRAPGFCVLDGLDPVVTGIHVTPEKTSFYNDPHTLDAFFHQWTYFARRYKGTSNKLVSFNLVNEPFWPPTTAERNQLRASMEGQSKEAIDRAIEARGAKEYARVARAAIEGIRAVDSQRLIVSDGSSGGVTPVPELFGTGVLQSPHDYFPPDLTHHQCEWARGWATRTEPPTWPLKDAQGKVTADRKSISDFLQP